VLDRRGPHWSIDALDRLLAHAIDDTETKTADETDDTDPSTDCEGLFSLALVVVVGW
jgi:hypothetical protein